MTAPRSVDDLLRELGPRVLGVLARRNADFAMCEDAVQDALLAAATTWPDAGLPVNPAGWLVTTAQRRLVETVRSEAARRRRERSDAVRVSPSGPVSATDDSLALLFLCCHQALTPISQMALTLRAVGGLSTAEIARALLVPEATVAQRISRAKARIRAAGASFGDLCADDRAERLPAVLGVLYLIFNEGHVASSGDAVHRVDLTAEAIRLARQLHEALPGTGEVAGLLALMLLTDARRPARVRDDGGLVPLAQQDRTRWDAAMIAEGVALVTATLASAAPGPFQVQAAIAAVHDEASRVEDTDWSQILGLYDVLVALAPSPMAELNRIVALAEVVGPESALAALDELAAELVGHHRVDAVRGHLLSRVGRHGDARELFLRAAQRTLSLPERQYLLEQAAAHRVR